MLISVGKLLLLEDLVGYQVVICCTQCRNANTSVTVTVTRLKMGFRQAGMRLLFGGPFVASHAGDYVPSQRDIRLEDRFSDSPDGLLADPPSTFGIIGIWTGS